MAIVPQAASTVLIALLPIYRSVAARVGSIGLELKSSRPQIEATAFAVIVASTLIRSL